MRGMPSARSARPLRVALAEADYLALLKGAAKGSRTAARLVAATEETTKGRTVHTVHGSRPELLLLRALALLHAPAAVRVIDQALTQEPRASRRG